MSIQSVHIWGFFDGDHRRMPDGGAPSELSPYDHFTIVRRNVHHFGGELSEVRKTRTLGSGWMVGVEFETPARPNGHAARMWHVISEPRHPWKDPAAHPTPEPAPVAGGEGL